MIENANLYKEISLEILNVLKKDDVTSLEELLNKRQDIIDSVRNIKEFKEILIENNILEIDKQIHGLLANNIDKTREQIKEHRLAKKANTSYAKFSKDKLNIFNQKV